jgi:hypothetical protein
VKAEGLNEPVGDGAALAVLLAVGDGAGDDPPRGVEPPPPPPHAETSAAIAERARKRGKSFNVVTP